MKILDNKRFLKNLSKWIFMYIGAMLLFGTIITYSRYISRFEGNGENKTARFDVKINCTKSNGKACNEDIATYDINQNNEFTYEFSVDTSNIDVKSKLTLLAFVDKSFEIVETNYCECGKIGCITCPSNINSNLYANTIYLPVENNVITSTIKVKYKGNIDDLSIDENNPTKKDVLVVGYAAEQINS